MRLVQCNEIWHQEIGTQKTYAWNIEITVKNSVSRNCAIGRKGDLYIVLINSHRTPVPFAFVLKFSDKKMLRTVFQSMELKQA